MSDHVWLLRQHTRQLGARRAAASGVWNDSASHTIARRHLDPLAESARRQYEASDAQLEHEERAETLVTQAEDLIGEGLDRIEHCQAGLSNAAEELRSGFEYIDHATELGDDATRRFDAAVEALSRAGARCGEATSAESIRDRIYTAEEAELELARAELAELAENAGKLLAVAGGALIGLEIPEEQAGQFVQDLYNRETWLARSAEVRQGWQRASGFLGDVRSRLGL